MLTQIFGIEIPPPVAVALIFFGLIIVVFLCTWLIRGFGGKRIGGMAASGRSRQPRLGVLDVLAIDGRRRLVIVRRDNVEHLVMIGGPNDVVVESGILRVPAGTNAQRDAPAFPAETRAAPPQPVPPSPASVPRERQPERPVPAQPAAVRAPEVPRQPTLAPQRAVEQPPVPPMREAPKVQPALQAPQAAQPTSSPTAPSPRPAPPPAAAPARRAPPAAAAPDSPAPAIPAPAAPAVAAAAKPAQQPIVAGPAPRTEGPRSSEIADRLAAALKRPVSPAADAPKPVPSAPTTPAPSAPVPPAPTGPKAEATAVPKPETPAPAPGPKVEAPSVRPDARPAPTTAPSTAPEDDDPLSSLEAEMANLLGRDMGKPKP